MEDSKCYKYKNTFKSLGFNKEINDWDVGNVTNMSSTFERSSFNQEIRDWDTSNVTDMSGMFWFSSFNKYLGDWDTSRVKDMGFLFRASSMRGGGQIYKWDVSSLVDVGAMFSHQHFNSRLQSLADEWSSTHSYNTGDVILHNNILYKSLQDSNQGEDPSTSTTYWQVHN